MIKDYDKMLDYIDKHIKNNSNDIINELAAQLGLSLRYLSDIFKFIDIEQRPVATYIRKRKLEMAMSEYANSMITLADINENYHYSKDTPTLEEAVKKEFGKTPGQMREEKYQHNPPMYLEDVLKNEGHEIMRKSDNYRADNEKLFEENKYLKESNENIRQMNKGKRRDFYERGIDLREYEEFLKIEDLRSVYGFGVYEMVWLHREHVKTGEPLEELCEKELYGFIDIEKEIEERFDEEQEEIEFERFLEEEMSIDEAYDYYHGDDSLDDLEENPYKESKDDIIF